MSEDYGKKVGKALEAVRRMHSDTSRLLQDCDGTIGKGRKSVFGNYATQDLKWHVQAEYWMGEAVYRYYYDELGPDKSLVDGVTVSFFDYKNRVDEPLLIVGRLKYHIEEQAQIKSVCFGWDLWSAFHDWAGSRQFDAVLHGASIDGGRIEWFNVIGVPLYSIQSMQAVELLMERVRKGSDDEQ